HGVQSREAQPKNTEHEGACGNASCVPFCITTLISCREYSRLASKRLDERLTVFEAICYWFHHGICMVCRRFNRQIHLIDKAGASLATDTAHDIEGVAGVHTLRPEAQERIRKHLQDNS
ncbi:MAG: hypothetical protein ACO3XO_09740, partial [Bdellovibrionota bacterium]